MVFFELCHRLEKLWLSLDRTSIVIFTKFSSLQIMLNYSSSCNSGSCLCPISKNISLQKLGLVSKDVKVILTMNPRPYWLHVLCINHNVKVTNAKMSRSLWLWIQGHTDSVYTEKTIMSRSQMLGFLLRKHGRYGICNPGFGSVNEYLSVALTCFQGNLSLFDLCHDLQTVFVHQVLVQIAL